MCVSGWGGDLGVELINKLYIKFKCIVVFEGFAPRSNTLVNCNQILGHVADQDIYRISGLKYA